MSHQYCRGSLKFVTMEMLRYTLTPFIRRQSALQASGCFHVRSGFRESTTFPLVKTRNTRVIFLSAWTVQRNSMGNPWASAQLRARLGPLSHSRPPGLGSNGSRRRPLVGGWRENQKETPRFQLSFSGWFGLVFGSPLHGWFGGSELGGLLFTVYKNRGF